MTLGPADAAWIAHHRRHAQLLVGTTATAPATVVGHLVAVQAQEHAYARWSIPQRMKGSPTSTSVDKAFDEGRILRTHVLRPTWHYVAPEDLRWLVGLTGPIVDAAAARRYQSLELDAKTRVRATDIIAATVADRPHSRRDLAQVLESKGIDPGGQRLPHLLMHAELNAVICSGPMQGKQHTYAPFDERVPGGAPQEADEALATLAARYFSTRGPATIRDFTWWSGLEAAQARRGLELAKGGLATRVIGDRHYFFREQTAMARRDQIDLVQCYDESIIAYTESRDVLQTGRAQFQVPLNPEGFPHVILQDARLLGRWRRREDRSGVRVESHIAVPLDRQTEVALHEAIDRYCEFAADGRTG